MLWYESLRPIALDWNGLQTQFRQQYSKIGNTREQVFHAWRSFQLNKISEKLDPYTYKTDSVIFRLWQITGLRSFKKYPSIKIILGSFSYRRFKTGSQNSKENPHKGENR